MDNIDLNSLRLFNEIFETGSLSRTADRMGLTQPAISIALGRLRRHFDDALFVRVGNTMKATPQAEGLIEGVRGAIAALEATLVYRSKFEPISTDRTFRLAMTDIGQIVLLPRLLDELTIVAPAAHIEVSNISERTPQQLEAGELDVAVGFVPQLSAGFFMQALFKERFACLARSDHPRIHAAPTLEQFRSESHVVVTTSGTGHLIVDKTLEERKIQRKVAVRIPNFLGLATIVGSTNYMCTLPRRAALIMAQSGAVSAWPTPFELPEYTVKQHWHERQARDPGNRWLRELLSGLFLKK